MGLPFGWWVVGWVSADRRVTHRFALHFVSEGGGLRRFAPNPPYKTVVRHLARRRSTMSFAASFSLPLWSRRLASDCTRASWAAPLACATPGRCTGGSGLAAASLAALRASR